MPDGKEFLGRGWSFPPSFVKQDGGGFVEMVVEKEDIDQSLGILFSTSLTERVMQPLYGCNLQDYQFEPMSSTMLGFVKNTIENAILYHEPRIMIERISVTESDSPDAMRGRLLIEVDYVIRSTNSRFNYVYNFYITEGSNDELLQSGK